MSTSIILLDQNCTVNDVDIIFELCYLFSSLTYMAYMGLLRRGIRNMVQYYIIARLVIQIIQSVLFHQGNHLILSSIPKNSQLGRQHESVTVAFFNDVISIRVPKRLPDASSCGRVGTR